MNEFLSTFTSARQVSLDDVISGWLASGGFGAPHLEPAPAAPLPTTAEARYKKLVSQGDLFLRFIPACDWFEVTFDPAWFSKVMLIEEGSWQHDAIGGERHLMHRIDLATLPTEHRERVASLRGHPSLNLLLHRKAVLFGHSTTGNWSILDGNHRLLALACQHLLDGRPVASFTVFVGQSQGPCRWHGDPVVWQERPERTPGEKRYILKIW